VGAALGLHALQLLSDPGIDFAGGVRIHLHLWLPLEPELLRRRGGADLDVGLPRRAAITAHRYSRAALRTSATVIRPSAPLPSTVSMSTSRSFAAATAAGVAFAFSA
jgi:hypothetical protein